VSPYGTIVALDGAMDGDKETVLCSDAYIVTPEATVVLAAPQQPFIKLDDKHYKLVDKMEALVDGYPSLIDCTSLKVHSFVTLSVSPRM
jgi:hypothetical protein